MNSYLPSHNFQFQERFPIYQFNIQTKNIPTSMKSHLFIYCLFIVYFVSFLSEVVDTLAFSIKSCKCPLVANASTNREINGR